MRTFASHCRLSKAGNNRSPFVVSCFVLLGSEFLPKLQPIAVGLIVVGFLVGLRGAAARADGGKLRFADRLGDHRVTVFTSPTPLRAGPVDVSVFVQDAETNELALDARVVVTATSQDRPAISLRELATTAAATNKLLQAANFDIPQPGSWALTVDIVSPRDTAQARLAVDVARPMPHVAAWVPWICWPLAPILLFGLHQMLVFRRESHLVRVETLQSPRRGQKRDMLRAQ